MRIVSSVLTLSVIGAIALLGSGCVSNMYPGGPTPAGLVYTEVTAPAQMLTVATDNTAKGMRKGEASSMAFLGLFAFGDGGLDAAMKSAGITKVHHVDHTVQHFLYCIFLRNKIVVYGE